MGDGSAQPEEMGRTGAAPDAAGISRVGMPASGPRPGCGYACVFDFGNVLVTGNMHDSGSGSGGHRGTMHDYVGWRTGHRIPDPWQKRTIRSEAATQQKTTTLLGSPLAR